MKNPLFGPAVLAALMALIVVQAEGLRGFAVFLNLEALVLVLAGTALSAWTAFPAGELRSLERRPEVLEHAAGAALAMGGLAAIFGTILALANWSAGDAAISRRFALAIVPLFFGAFLSKAVLSPLARRVRLSRCRAD